MFYGSRVSTVKKLIYLFDFFLNDIFLNLGLLFAKGASQEMVGEPAALSPVCSWTPWLTGGIFLSVILFELVRY